MTKEEWDILLERYNDLKLSGNIQDIVKDIVDKKISYEDAVCIILMSLSIARGDGFKDAWDSQQKRIDKVKL